MRSLLNRVAVLACGFCLYAAFASAQALVATNPEAVRSVVQSQAPVVHPSLGPGILRGQVTLCGNPNRVAEGAIVHLLVTRTLRRSLWFHNENRSWGSRSIPVTDPPLWVSYELMADAQGVFSGSVEDYRPSPRDPVEGIQDSYGYDLERATIEWRGHQYPATYAERASFGARVEEGSYGIVRALDWMEEGSRPLYLGGFFAPINLAIPCERVCRPATTSSLSALTSLLFEAGSAEIHHVDRVRLGELHQQVTSGYDWMVARTSGITDVQIQLRGYANLAEGDHAAAVRLAIQRLQLAAVLLRWDPLSGSQWRGPRVRTEVIVEMLPIPLPPRRPGAQAALVPSPPRGRVEISFLECRDEPVVP